jgi:hypothetical protein
VTCDLEAKVCELAVLIGRTQGGGIIDRQEALFCAGCLVELAEAANVPLNSIRQAIHPFDFNEAKAESNR